MPGRNFLFIPGPTNVPRRIQNAMYVEPVSYTHLRAHET